MNWKALVVFLVPNLMSASAWADPPLSYLLGANIEVDGKPLSGYLGVYEPEAIDPAAPDVLGQIKRYKKIGFVRDVIELKNLYDQRGRREKHAHAPFISTREKMRFLDTRLISKVSLVARPFDNMRYYARIGYLPKARAERLAGEVPVFACTAQYSESPTLYWVSFDKSVGRDKIEPICNSIEAPAKAIANQLLKHPDVFTVAFESD